MQSSSSKKVKKTLEDVASDSGLRRFVGYRLKRAYSSLREDLLLQLEPLGLRITTFSALLSIVENPGLRQSAIASLLDIRTSNMVAIIDDLERRDMIIRKQVPVDRRAFALYATDNGKYICNRAVNVAKKNEASIMDSLDTEELISLSVILEKIESSRG